MVVGSCGQIVNMLSASNECPQIREGEDHDQRSLTSNSNNNNNSSSSNNKMMIMAAATTEVEVEGETKVMEKPSQEQIQLQQQPLKCPRCESTNTKFCYYNNYSLTQPRHFCKACKRYWTRGGTLRSVPVGGGCRKNKRVRRPSSHFTSTTTTTTKSNNSSSNISDSSNTFNSHSLKIPSGMGGGGGGGGAHLINPLLYGLPTHHASPHEAIINGFPFSSYDHQHQLSGLGLGFSSSAGIQLGCGDHGGNRNGYSTTSTKQILQDLISNSNSSSLVSPFHGSSNTNTTCSTTLPTMSMSSLLNSSLQHQQQQKFSFESLFPYELDLHIKGVGSSHGNEGVYVKDDGVKMEGDGQIQTLNGYEIHDHHHHQQPMGESNASILWNNSNTNGTSIGVNWLDPNYSSIGSSSSVPSLI